MRRIDLHVHTTASDGTKKNLLERTRHYIREAQLRRDKAIESGDLGQKSKLDKLILDLEEALKKFMGTAK